MIFHAMNTPIQSRTRPLTGALKDLRPALKTTTTEHDDLEHFDDEVCGPSGLANAVWYLLRRQPVFPTIRIVRARRDADGVWQCVEEARFGLGDGDDGAYPMINDEVRWDVGDGPNGLGSHSVIGQGPFSDNDGAVACEIMSWLADPELQLFWVKE